MSLPLKLRNAVGGSPNNHIEVYQNLPEESYPEVYFEIKEYLESEEDPAHRRAAVAKLKKIKKHHVKERRGNEKYFNQLIKRSHNDK
jgi:hypothetical protein